MLSTDDTLVEDGFNNCDIPQEIQELENESGCEEFPSKWLKFTRKKILIFIFVYIIIIVLIF